jgi:hypothetical protein
VAQSHTPYDHCVRFAVVVTFHEQHSLPGGCYPFPGPDFHRLDRASFAWRTAIPSRRVDAPSSRVTPLSQMQLQPLDDLAGHAAAGTLDHSYSAANARGLRPRRFGAGGAATSGEVVTGWLGLRPRRFAAGGASDTDGLSSAWCGERPRPSCFARAERRSE